MVLPEDLQPLFALRPPPSATENVLGPAGGRLQSSDGLVRLDFPAEAVKTDTSLTLQVGFPAAPRVTWPELVWLTFDLALSEGAGDAAAHLAFDRPVSVTVDLAGFPQWLRPYLAHQIDGERDIWERVDATYDAQAQSLTAQVESFSTYALGGDSHVYGGWQLQYNAPSVALFRGAASYSYPLELPRARGRLSPAVSLSYNNARVDGILALVDSPRVGLGWTLDTLEIVRDDIRLTWPENSEWISVGHNFVLLMNGTAYRLVPGDAGLGSGRYYATNGPQLYVERRNEAAGNGSGENYTSEYWIVRTPDGSEYRLGYRADAEQKLYRVYGTSQVAGPTYTGTQANYAVYRWRLDQVKDVFGNKLELLYTEYSGGYGNRRDTASLLNEIRYDQYGANQWATRVVFVTAAPSRPQPGDVPFFGPEGQLNRIEVWHLGQRVSYYDLGYSVYPPLASYPWEGETRELTAIRQYSGDGSQSLPATTFSYVALPNKDADLTCDPYSDPQCWYRRVQFHYPRLAVVANGYGGRTEFSYASDGRKDSDRLYQNYRVTQQRVYDGIHPTPAILNYAYGTRCYDQTGSAAGATLCPSWTTAELVGPLAGHQQGTVRSLDYDGTLLGKTAHDYHADAGYSLWWRQGRELRRRRYRGESEPHAQQDTTRGVSDLSVAAPVADRKSAV